MGFSLQCTKKDEGREEDEGEDKADHQVRHTVHPQVQAAGAHHHTPHAAQRAMIKG
jgi:hypothetical protein